MTAREGVAAVGWFAFGRTVLLSVAAAADRMRDGDGSVESLPIRELRSDGLEAARVAFRASLHDDDMFAVLAANAALSPDDAEMFAVLAAAASDRSCRDLVAALHADGNRAVPSLGLLAEIGRHLRNDVADRERSDEQATGRHAGVLAVRHDSALVRSCFVDVEQDGPWADHRVRLHPSVVWALVGDDSRDPELPDGITLVEVDPAPDVVVGRADFVVVNGPDRMRRRLVGAGASIGERFVCSPLPASERAWSALVREATLTGRGVIVETTASLGDEGRSFIERANHLVWVLSAPSGPPIAEMPRRPWLDVWAAAPDPTDEEWAAAFGDDVPRTHRLTLDQLDRVGRAFRAGDDPQAALDAAVRRLASGDLERLTTRKRPTRTWDDVVVSPDRQALLEDIVERYRRDHQVYDEWAFAPNPSRGLVALFSGPSGTGKTLAAEIVAGELGLDLFKLDLSSVVSKYIGETEQNLDQIFDAASAGNVVLFFDEADSLFGKRSEVRDARDRYANIEVSYLLQRLETYDGLVVMATNFEKNVDDAFLRRIHVRVPFAMPAADERLRIWQQNLPDAAPIGDVDLDWLAQQFELSGASIRNAAVQAAFVAARTDGTAIATEHLVLGVVHELRKTGRLITPSDFGPFASLVSE